MKAIVYTKYGPPEVLQLTELEKPKPDDDQVLVKTHAASINPADWHRMTPPFLARMVFGLLKPKNLRLGSDLAGTVEAVGRSVTGFKPGDEVFGVAPGAFAEYACAGESRLVLKPANVSFEAAAATPIVGCTAIQGLRDNAQIRAGQKLLVNGASGGVGTFAVQFAKSVGAEVTGVCSTRNLDMVRSIGADYVIDYTREDFTRNGRHYDLIFDAIGNRSVFDYQRALIPQGKCVIAGYTGMPRLIEYMILGSFVSKVGSKKIAGMGIANVNREDLLLIKDLLEAGKVMPVIDKRYPMSKMAEAMRHLGSKHARGKVVITFST